ncbi:MAG: FAD-binding oxidoreductase [Dethiobacteria bacterium]
MSRKDRFLPDWIEEAPPEGSYRSIFKWGDPLGFRHPSKGMYRALKEAFGMTDKDFKAPHKTGFNRVDIGKRTVNLERKHIKKFKEIVGDENVKDDDYSRLYYSTGKTIEEAWELRDGIIREICDVTVHPRNKKEVAEIVAYCHDHQIPIYVFGGGSSVNFGLRPEKGGISLVLKTHMNKIVEINEEDRTCTVEAGIFGPAYEGALNNARERFNTKYNYTCGHFPQSFEYSSVGGWIVTLGSGQASTYYGDAYDLILSGEYVTPIGTIMTEDYVHCANGPRVNDIMKGSEGCFGILVEVKMKIFRHMPRNRFRYGYIFKTWEDAVNAAREICQGEFGLPSVLRISDQEETDVGLKLYGIEGTAADSALRLMGYKPGSRSLMLGHTEGERKFSRNVRKKIHRIARKHGAMSITGYAAKKWEHSRYTDPYLREDLQDYGIITDTLETSVLWSNLHKIHKQVRAFAKSRPGTICMTHASHFYPYGTNLYFIFFAKMDDINEYREFQARIVDEIIKSGGSLSHHHGVGKMLAPWMEHLHGPRNMGIYRVLKQYFDPKGILNPGAQMGLDNSRDDDPDYRFARRKMK